MMISPPVHHSPTRLIEIKASKIHIAPQIFQTTLQWWSVIIHFWRALLPSYIFIYRHKCAKPILKCGWIGLGWMEFECPSSMSTTLRHWGYLSQKHTVWREGGGSLFLIRLTAPTIISDTLVTGMLCGANNTIMEMLLTSSCRMELH